MTSKPWDKEACKAYERKLKKKIAITLTLLCFLLSLLL